jgi:hypothetical protein
MKIADIRTIPLVGATPDGGWEQGYDPGDNLHTLVEIITDEGLEKYSGMRLTPSTL